jgi:HSP20 family protein
MSATNTGPVSGSLERLRQEIDRVVESAWTQGERAMDVIGLRRSSCPAVDIIEHPERVQVAIDLPGVIPDAIELSIVGNMLTVQGTYAPLAGEGSQVHLSERPHGSFKRSVPLPASVNADDIRAESRHGVLHVSVGKVETAKSRRIPVTGASHADL